MTVLAKLLGCRLLILRCTTLSLFNPDSLAIVAVGLQKYSIEQPSLLLGFPVSLFRTTSLLRPKGFCVVCIINLVSGHIWDVAVDLRRDSADFGKWAGFHLKPRNETGQIEMLWIPEGFAHGFLVLSDTAEVLYKTTNLYYPEGERSILWDDPTLNIAWPLEGITPSLSAKDAKGSPFLSADLP
jgi:hypothetical protein